MPKEIIVFDANNSHIMPKEIIVFDANFFICMLSIRAKDVLRNLEKAGKDLDLDYYISEVVFGEIKGPHTYRERLARFVNVENVTDSEITIVKDNLSKFNVKFPAQDPDLSLLVLSERLIEEN
ncbi:MAG: hypothetical protein ACTSP9_18395, partial [Promethearchaeota archaeon]